MVKICSKCGFNNDDASFWCNKCGEQLNIKPSQEEDTTNENKEEKQTIEVEEYDFTLPCDEKLKKRNKFFQKLKIPISVFVIVIIIISSFLVNTKY